MTASNELLISRAEDCLIKSRAYALPKEGHDTEQRLEISALWLQAYKDCVGLISISK